MNVCAQIQRNTQASITIISIIDWAQWTNTHMHACIHFIPIEFDDAYVHKLLDASRILVQPYKMWFSIWSTENMKWQILKYKMYKHMHTLWCGSAVQGNNVQCVCACVCYGNEIHSFGNGSNDWPQNPLNRLIFDELINCLSKKEHVWWLFFVYVWVVARSTENEQ